MDGSNRRETRSMLSSPKSVTKRDLEEATDCRKSPRRQTKVSRFDFDELENEEQMLLQKALQLSQKETKRVILHAEEAPVFTPTIEEFQNPLEYISSIRAKAEEYGLAKIVPPRGWKPTCQIAMESTTTFSTKLQEIHKLQEGEGFDDGGHYTIGDYKKMADDFKQKWSAAYHSGHKVTAAKLEQDYWNAVETSQFEISVEYANDIDTTKYASGFPAFSRQECYSGVEEHTCSDMFSEDYYARSGWNLRNIPFNQKSLLRYLRVPVNGVNVPWLYIGMLFSSFCWHNEDNYFYSINYSHFGDGKQWYGIPAAASKRFEKVSKQHFFESFRDKPDLLHHMTTQISPSLLISNGVPVYKTIQEAGTFIVTFPQAYHAGFSYGFNCGEAVNFATPDWLITGGQAEEHYRQFSRGSVISHHRLLWTLYRYRDDLRPSQQAVRDLMTEILRVIEEEVTTRKHLVKQGVRKYTHDLAGRKVTVKANKFDVIDEECLAYDETRTCCICKHVCVFTAIVCECSKDRVSCIRHYQSLCRCSRKQKKTLEWISNEGFETMRSTITAALAAPAQRV